MASHGDHRIVTHHRENAMGGLSTLIMRNYAIQRSLRLPLFLRPGLGAVAMILLGLFVGVLLSGPSYAQSRHDGSDPAVTVPELEDLAEVMADPAARKMLLSRILHLTQ